MLLETLLREGMRREWNRMDEIMLLIFRLLPNPKLALQCT